MHQIANEKSIPVEAIEEIVESAMLSAYKKQYGITNNVRANSTGLTTASRS